MFEKINMAIGCLYHEHQRDLRLAARRELAAAEELLAAAKLTNAMFDKGHAISRFNWRVSPLRAEDIRELNEVPLRLARAIAAIENAPAKEQSK